MIDSVGVLLADDNPDEMIDEAVMIVEDNYNDLMGTKELKEREGIC